MLVVYPLPSRRSSEGGASTNQNCRAPLCKIPRFLRGAENWDGGEVTSDETNSTYDHLVAQGSEVAVRLRWYEEKRN